MGDKNTGRRGKGRAPKPEKICPVCERPFTWRARWRNNWNQIVYCSRRCASQRHTLRRKDA